MSLDKLAASELSDLGMCSACKEKWKCASEKNWVHSRCLRLESSAGSVDKGVDHSLVVTFA